MIAHLRDELVQSMQSGCQSVHLGVGLLMVLHERAEVLPHGLDVVELLQRPMLDGHLDVVDASIVAETLSEPDKELDEVALAVLGHLVLELRVGDRCSHDVINRTIKPLCLLSALVHLPDADAGLPVLWVVTVFDRVVVGLGDLSWLSSSLALLWGHNEGVARFCTYHKPDTLFREALNSALGLPRVVHGHVAYVGGCSCLVLIVVHDGARHPLRFCRRCCRVT